MSGVVVLYDDIFWQSRGAWSVIPTCACEQQTLWSVAGQRGMRGCGWTDVADIEIGHDARDGSGCPRDDDGGGDGKGAEGVEGGVEVGRGESAGWWSLCPSRSQDGNHRNTATHM